MNKAGRINYLNEDEELLVIAPANIEGDHCLPLDCCGVEKQLHIFFKAIKSRFGDNNILENPP